MGKIFDDAIRLQKAIVANIPTVLFLNDIPSLEVGAVIVDERKAVEEITQYVISLGHKNILYLDGYRRYTERYNDYINQERYAGFTDAIKKAGIDLNMTKYAEFAPEYYQLEDLGPLEKLLIGRNRPSAVVSFHDRIAVWLLSRLERAGVSVPEYLSVTGFDNIEELDYVHPKLTTVHNPFDRVAQEVITLLTEGIESGKQPRRKVSLLAETIIRDSCAENISKVINT